MTTNRAVNSTPKKSLPDAPRRRDFRKYPPFAAGSYRNAPLFGAWV